MFCFQGLYDKNRLSNTSATLLLLSLRVTVHMPTTAVRKANFEVIKIIHIFDPLVQDLT